MSMVRVASATLAGAVALGLGFGLTACGSATQPAAASHPAASSPTVAQPDALAILRQTGATPDPGTTSGEHDAYGNLVATGSLPGGASASVHTSASQAAFSAEKSRAVGAYTGSDFTAGVVAIPAEWTVIIVNSGSSGTWAKGVAPAQIAARVHGTVLLSTTPPAAAPPKTTPPAVAPPVVPGPRSGQREYVVHQPVHPHHQTAAGRPGHDERPHHADPVDDHQDQPDGSRQVSHVHRDGHAVTCYRNSSIRTRAATSGCRSSQDSANGQRGTTARSSRAA